MAVKDVAAWKKKKVHEVKLPSGADVEIQVPNLPALIKSGKIPNTLLDEAIKAAEGKQQVTAESIGEQNDFTRKLVAMSVVSPELQEEDVDDIPFEDIELIIEIATRQRDVDAEGKHIGGLHTSEEWRRFRQFPGSDEGVEGT